MKIEQARIDRAVRYMKSFMASESAKAFVSLEEGAQFMYIMGILLCDNVGVVNRKEVTAAMNDPDARWAVMCVISRVEALSGGPDPFTRYP